MLILRQWIDFFAHLTDLMSSCQWESGFLKTYNHLQGWGELKLGKKILPWITPWRSVLNPTP